MAAIKVTTQLLESPDGGVVIGIDSMKRRASTLATELDEDRISFLDTEDSYSTLPSSEEGCDQAQSEGEESASALGGLKDPNSNDCIVAYVNASLSKAQDLEDIGELGEALSILGPLLEVVGRFNHYGHTQLRVGTLFWRKGAYGASLHHLAQALFEFEMMGADDEVICEALLALGRTFLSTASIAEAKKHFRLAVKHASNNEALYARAMHGLGNVFETVGKLGKANRHYQIALAIQRKGDHAQKTHTASTLVSFGSLKIKQGDLDLSLDCYKEAHRILRTMEQSAGTSFDIGVVLSGIGWVFFMKGDLECAMTACAAALEQLTPMNEHRNVAAVLLQMGIIEAKQGRSKQAKLLCDEALILQRKLLGNTLDLAFALTTIATVVENRPSQCIQYLTQAMKIRLHVLGPEHVAVGYSYADLGNAYLNAGMDGLARECHSRASSILEQTN